VSPRFRTTAVFEAMLDAFIEESVRYYQPVFTDEQQAIHDGLRREDRIKYPKPPEIGPNAKPIPKDERGPVERQVDYEVGPFDRFTRRLRRRPTVPSASSATYLGFKVSSEPSGGPGEASDGGDGTAVAAGGSKALAKLEKAGGNPLINKANCFHVHPRLRDLERLMRRRSGLGLEPPMPPSMTRLSREAVEAALPWEWPAPLQLALEDPQTLWRQVTAYRARVVA
jgi:hypothetical protein